MIDCVTLKSDQPRRIYLDNAATSFPKPPEVLAAMNRYMIEIGANAGRSTYAESLDADAIVWRCRRKLAKLLNAPRAESIVFTHNCTDALNIAIHGAVQPGKSNHFVCSSMEHNSVVRPMQELVARGLATMTIVEGDPKTGYVEAGVIAAALREDTRLVAITHASNVNGVVMPIREIAARVHESSALFLVDAAQTAGHWPIDVLADGIDLLAAPGHKGLLGPLGTGLLYVRPGVEDRLTTLRQGGTGSQSSSLRHPTKMPDRFEAGSQNVLGLAGLLAAVEWIERKGIGAIQAHEQRLIQQFIEKVDQRHVVGRPTGHEQVGVFSIVSDELDPAELSTVLEQQFGVLTRAGLHCAALAHKTLGTDKRGGTTRVSFGPFNTAEDLQDWVTAIVLARS